MSTTEPRLRFNRYAPGRIRAISASPIIPRVCGVSGTCSVTKSQVRSTSASEGSGWLLPIGSFAPVSK